MDTIQEKPAETHQAYHHGNLRNDLLNVALKIMDEQGHEKLSLRQLARLCNVSQAAPFRHFANKQDLLAALAELGFRRLIAAMTKAGQNVSRNPMQLLKCLASGYVQFASENKALFRLMYSSDIGSHDNYPGLKTAADTSSQLVKNAITESINSGQMKGDVDQLVLAAWSLTAGFSMLLINEKITVLDDLPEKKREEATDELIKNLTTIFFSGCTK